MEFHTLVGILMHLAFLMVELALAGYIYEQAKKLREDRLDFLDTQRKHSAEEYNYRKRIQEEYQESKKSLIKKIKEYLATGKDITGV